MAVEDGIGRRHPSDVEPRISTRDQIMAQDAEGPAPVVEGCSFDDAGSKAREADREEIAKLVGKTLAGQKTSLTEGPRSSLVGLESGGLVEILKPAALAGREVRSGAIADADRKAAALASQRGPRRPA